MFASDITTGDEDGITMTQAALIGHVEQFKPGTDDWEQYTERLEQYFKANSIEADDKKLATFLTVIGPTAYALLSNLLAPEKPATKTYAELVTVVRDHLKPKPLVIAERFRFHQRNQADSESVADYMAELRKLADKCEFGELSRDNWSGVKSGPPVQFLPAKYGPPWRKVVRAYKSLQR